MGSECGVWISDSHRLLVQYDNGLLSDKWTTGAVLCPSLFKIETLAKQKEYFYFECRNITLWPTSTYTKSVDFTILFFKKSIFTYFSIDNNGLLFVSLHLLVRIIFKYNQYIYLCSMYM